MKLLVNLRQSVRFKKFLYLGIIFSTLLYVFFIPSFGERSSTLKYLVYGSMTLLGLLVIVYNIVYLDFKITATMLLLIIFTMFAIIGTTLYSHEYRRWLSLLLLITSLFIFVYAFRIIKKRDLIVAIIAIAFLLFSLYYVWHYRSELVHFKEFVAGRFRLGNYFDNPNGVAAYAVAGFGSAAYCVLFTKRKIRFLFIIPVLLSGVVGISTGSKSFIFACLLFVIVFLYFVFRKHKIIYLISLAVVIGLFILFLQIPFMSTIKERILHAFLTIFGEADKADTATIERTIWFDYGLFLGYKNGLFGYGANGFATMSGVGTYTHSNISEVLCDFGFIGFVLFYSPLIILLVKTIFDKRIDKPLVVSFIVYYIFIGISNVFYYKKVYYMILALCFYIVYFENPHKRIFFKNKDITTVVFTCESLLSGGAERVISILANDFSIKNINVYIVGISDNDMENVFYKLDQNVKYIPLIENCSKKPNFFKKTYLLRKQINKINPDVVISFLPHINFYTTCALIGNKKVCHVVSERNNPITNPKGIIRKIAKRISFDFADGCVFQSTGAQKAYPDLIQEKSTIILNPVSVPDISLEGRKMNNVFVNVGRLVPQKNQSLLIDAFNEFNEKHNNEYILRIYGSGPLKEELSKKCSNYIQILEPDVDWLIKEKNARCFVLSSDYEGMPNTLIEALSIGLPCISSNCDIGGPEELHNRGFDFYLFKTGDKEDLIKCMEEVAKEKEINNKYNIELVNKLLNEKSIAGNWLSYIHSV